MAQAQGGTSPLVWVQDISGNEYLCPAGVVSDRRNASAEELGQCTSDSLLPYTTAS